MPQPHKRSRSLRRVYITTPGGINKILYKRRNPKQARCSNCGTNLHGVKRGVSSIIRNLSSSSKHPKRIFAGNLCYNCTKRQLISMVRK